MSLMTVSCTSYNSIALNKSCVVLQCSKSIESIRDLLADNSNPCFLEFQRNVDRSTWASMLTQFSTHTRADILCLSFEPL
jgi:hypothetical protein